MPAIIENHIFIPLRNRKSFLNIFSKRKKYILYYKSLSLPPMVVAISALILWLSGASVSSEQLFSETENRPDSTVTVPETVDTLVEYSYKAFDFGEIKHPSPEEKIPFIMSEEERKRKHEEYLKALRPKLDRETSRLVWSQVY